MFKLEIEIDREILEKDGWDFDYSIGVLCDGLKKAGFNEEINENGRLLYAGTNSDKDLAYMGLVAESLVKEDWFKKCCKKWLLLSDIKSEDGSFHIEGDWIKTYKKHKEC